MDKNYIVFQAYGSKDILNEVLIAVASIIKVTSIDSCPSIYIYTDSKAYLSEFLPDSITFIDTPKDQWNVWKGDKNFVHRAKIEMLRDFCARVEGNILYCDTDTYFLNNPRLLFENIQSQFLLMHLDEGSLKDSSNLVFKKLEKFLRNYTFNGNAIHSTTHMWNAGVLGFRSADKLLLDEVLDLSDDLYNSFPKHVMEQLSFSVIFSKRNRQACDNSIFHYWDFKEYREFLKTFFLNHSNSSFKEWLVELDQVEPIRFYKRKKDYLTKPYLFRKLRECFLKPNYFNS